MLKYCTQNDDACLNAVTSSQDFQRQKKYLKFYGASSLHLRGTGRNQWATRETSSKNAHFAINQVSDDGNILPRKNENGKGTQKNA